MSRVYELYRRLESIQPFGDLERGFRAEVHDPVWFLGRQWQMGEHHGEDASSPVEVRYALDQIPLLPFDGNPELDPQVVPPEEIVLPGVAQGGSVAGGFTPATCASTSRWA